VKEKKGVRFVVHNPQRSENYGWNVFPVGQEKNKVRAHPDEQKKMTTSDDDK
jgi:hypothetical protein